MASFLKKHAKPLRSLMLLAFMGLPFLLYLAAMAGRGGLVYLLLGVMGLFMLLALKVG